MIRRGFEGTIGNTPLIRLNALSEETGCEILGKAEFLNPGGSVKDRAALFIIQRAEREGLLKKGGTVVEGTAGNTGIGLAHICLSRGYKCIIYIPDNQSPEKFQLLKALGAEVRAVPPVPYSDPNHYQKQARRAGEEIDGAIWANQFDNTANREAHYQTTGPEIWEQTGGEIDAWVAATGTGGTLAGVAAFLKEKKPDVKVFLADPYGSSLYNYIKTGELKREGSSFIEGIGIGRVTANLEGAPIDDAVRIDDRRAIEILYRLLDEEGLFLGGSSAINVAAAIEVAKKLGPGHTIVTVLCDGGGRYLSRLYSKEWLEEKGVFDAVPEKSKKRFL